MDYKNEHQQYFERVKAVSQMRSRHVSVEEIAYMRNHKLAELNAAQLIRHAQNKGVNVNQLNHRVDILRAIDNHNGKKL